MQQAIRSEIVGEIEFRKQIAVQISRARAKSPAMLALARNDVCLVLKAYWGALSRAGLLPEKHVFGSAVERPRKSAPQSALRRRKTSFRSRSSMAGLLARARLI